MGAIQVGRGIFLAATLLLAGCSFEGVGPESSGPSTPATSQASAPELSQSSPSALAVELLRLKSQESVRGAEVLVPDGWTMVGSDGGGSGSMSGWTDPANDLQWIAVWDGMELGAWLETDGVKGSVDPAGMLPEGAEVVRESRTVFRYSIAHPSNGQIVRGAWIAGVDEVSGQADGYERVEVSLPVEQDSVVEEILGAFIEQAKARFAGGDASAGGVGDMGQSEDGSPGQSGEPAGAGFEFPSRSVQSEIVRRLDWWTGNPLCLEIQLAQSSSDWGLRWFGDYALDHPDECDPSDGTYVVTRQGDAWVDTDAGGSVFFCSDFEPGGMFATIGAPPSVMRDLRAEFLDDCNPDG